MRIGDTGDTAQTHSSLNQTETSKEPGKVVFRLEKIMSKQF